MLISIRPIHAAFAFLAVAAAFTLADSQAKRAPEPALTEEFRPLWPPKPESEDPMRKIAAALNDATERLGQQETGRPVQVKQEEAVRDLSALITTLEKSCSGSGGGSLNPSKPLGSSVITGGPGGINDLHDPKAGEKQWGTLKPKEREKILQSQTDGFPQNYESLLQGYYRRLASDEPIETPAPPATSNEPAAR